MLQVLKMLLYSPKWRLDNIDSGVEEQQMSVEDHRVLTLWEDTTWKEDGHYYCHIPFKSHPPGLPNNKMVAEKRLGSLRRRLLGDRELHCKYKEGMEDMLVKGFVEPVDEEDSPQGAMWYMPHHCVENSNKAKIRIVFDSTAPYKGTSLNKQVYQGPDLMNNLLGVLLRFREQCVAVMGDVEAMFHQIKVPVEDRDVLRFLWYQDDDMTLTKVYRFTVHPFGGVWSPSCASYALRRAALDQETFNKEIRDTVLRNFYLDDCLKSVETDQKASDLIKGLCEMLAQGGFRLTKWVSSSREVIETVPVEERAKDVKDLDLDKDQLPIQRALGVHWKVEEDILGLKTQPKTQPFTRRGLLSVISSIYDPIGLVCPFVLRAKIILQSVCRSSLAWDEELDDVQKTEWCLWLEELPRLEDFSCIRSLVPEEFGDVVHASLHHFGDASEAAYGTASYLRLVNGDGRIHCSFLLGKSRLAPLKSVTIPRLELMAAVLAVKVDGNLRSQLSIQLEPPPFWTDSMIVFHYIKAQSKRFHTFVANRVNAIHRGSSVDQWRHVPGELNPADEASRGLHADQLVQQATWLNGPDFLSEMESSWPGDPDIDPDLLSGDAEVKQKAEVLTVQAEETKDSIEDLLKRYLS